jgi:DNA-binding response OmpR family regulator
VNYVIDCTIDRNLNAEIDREKFEKIINNLISNAIKFTSSGGSVAVKAWIENNQILFTITDTGKGIRPEDLPHVFDRYYQGNQHEMSLEGGTGIGLSIAREYCILMGGSINVDSILGKETVFNVSIPLIASQHPADDIEFAEVGSIKPKAAANKAKQQLIMLVEDHPEMIEYIASVLKPAYRVITSSDGNEALSILKGMKALPDMIISDVMMPGMDGFTLLNTLKKDDVLCKVPVIMLTALADSRNKLKALNIGVDDYLTKPFVVDELKARVTNLLHNAAERKKPADEKDDEKQEFPVVGPSPSDLIWLAELETKVRKYIGKTDLNLAAISYDMAMSERQLFRRVKTTTGLTPNMYIRSIRLQVAREAIESGKYRTVAEISYTAGFETPAYFSKLFKEHYGRDVNDLL